MIEDDKINTLRLTRRNGDMIVTREWPQVEITTGERIGPDHFRWPVISSFRDLGADRLERLPEPMQCPLYYCMVNKNMLTHRMITDDRIEIRVCEGEHPMYFHWTNDLLESIEEWEANYGVKAISVVRRN